MRFQFSGHESFQCRTLWLKKGYDFILQNRSFSDDNAVTILGVGKNMVSSIRFWLKAFNIISPKDEITEFGRKLLDGENGWDPYLEDDSSLWLLHYQLVKNKFASTYYIIFNEFRRERIEFTRENYVSYIKRRDEVEKGLNFNQNTIEADFDVFRKLYLATREEAKGIEDSFSGLLCDLDLLKTFKKEKKDWLDGKEKIVRYDAYFIENSERLELPYQVLLFAILDNEKYGRSISLLNLEQDVNGPASIFAINRAGLIDKINEITENNKNIIFNDHAGIKELQFKTKEDRYKVISEYYEGKL